MVRARMWLWIAELFSCFAFKVKMQLSVSSVTMQTYFLVMHCSWLLLSVLLSEPRCSLWVCISVRAGTWFSQTQTSEVANAVLLSDMSCLNIPEMQLQDLKAGTVCASEVPVIWPIALWLDLVPDGLLLWLLIVCSWSEPGWPVRPAGGGTHAQPAPGWRPSVCVPRQGQCKWVGLVNPSVVLLLIPLFVSTFYSSAYNFCLFFSS